MFHNVRCVGGLALSVILGCLVVSGTVEAQAEPVRLQMDPAQITAAPGPTQYIMSFGTLGTELVTLIVVNDSARVVEFPDRRWLVVEGKSVTEAPVFTPSPPYIPLSLNPGDKVTIPWRLREPAYVHFGGGPVERVPRVYAGEYRIILHYRYAGESAWRQVTRLLQVESHSMPGGWIGVVVVILICVIVFWLQDART